ncbi:MAG: hypothetical protein PCFJNLEI_02750 [Verrucomicrobiae bacterium]|nr:hypothetical protein [Verrucomicrobiae bacterium]
MVIAASSAAVAGTPAIPERRDLLPQRVRWQTYPVDVTRVIVDRSGKPWFEVSGTSDLAGVKAQVEGAAKLAAPYLRGANILLFDRRGRVWLIPQCNQMLLLGYDPATGQWQERAGVPVE